MKYKVGDKIMVRRDSAYVSERGFTGVITRIISDRYYEAEVKSHEGRKYLFRYSEEEIKPLTKLERVLA